MDDYKSFFENVPIALYRSTPGGIITDINPAMLQMLGYAEAEKDVIVGMGSSGLYYDLKDQEKWQRMIHDKGLVVNFEVRLKQRGGQMIWVRENSRAVRDAQGRVILYEGSMEDISAEKTAREELQSQAGILNAINRLLSETIACESVKDVAETCLDLAVEITGSGAGFIGEVNKDGRLDTIALNAPGWQECSMDWAQAPKMIRDMPIAGLWGRVIMDGKSLIANNPDQHPDSAGTPSGHPRLQCFLGVPLNMAGRTTGIIGLTNKEKGYLRRDLEHIEKLTASFTLALQRKKTEQDVKESEAQFQAIAAMAHDAVIMINSSGRTVYWNRSAEKIFGYTAGEAIGKDLHAMLAPQKYMKQYKAGIEAFKKTGSGNAIGKTLELTAVRKDGATFPIELSLSTVELKGEWHAIGIVRDITERVEMKKELQRLSYLDGLTQVPNRRLFDVTLTSEWLRSARDGIPLSIIIADIDFFKAYNDTYGHQQGDECLKKVARCISNQLKRPGDLAARYGGEEFALILPGTDIKGAAAMAEKIRKSIAALRISHEKSEISENVTLSMGIASAIPEPDAAAVDLVAAADRALYMAKKGGRNRIERTDAF